MGLALSSSSLVDSFSEEEDLPPFGIFLNEIEEYFNYVTQEVLGWHPKEIQINWGHNNVVLKFSHLNETFLFRVPKFTPLQIRAARLASSYFQGESFFPEIVYFDHKCVIERFVFGRHLETASIEHLKDLAISFSKIHKIPAEGLGPLLCRGQGEFTKLVEFPGPSVEHRLQKSYQLGYLKRERAFETAFFNYYANYEKLPSSICHGDFWSGNGLCTVTGRVSLIDWESLGAYPFYQDLKFLHSSWMDEKRKSSFVVAYEKQSGKKLDLGMSAFVAFYKELTNSRGMVVKKLQRLQREFMQHQSTVA